MPRRRPHPLLLLALVCLAAAAPGGSARAASGEILFLGFQTVDAAWYASMEFALENRGFTVTVDNLPDRPLTAGYLAASAFVFGALFCVMFFMDNMRIHQSVS